MADPHEKPSPEKPPPEDIGQLRARLEEAEETLRAIREGEVDAVVVTGAMGEQVFTLSSAERIYRVVVETMAEAAFTVTFDGTILFCNAQFGQFVRRPMERIVGQPLHEFVAPDNRASADALLGLSRKQPVRQRLVFQDADGSAVPAYVSANVMDQPDGLSICVVASDLTELENSTELIQQLRLQQEALRRQSATLEGINGVLAAALACATERDLGVACLEIAQKLTQSRFGFLGEINERGLQDIAVSNPGLDACNIIDAGGHRRSGGCFKIHGIYGRVLADGKALFTNDPANHPDRIGLPAGLPPLESFLGAPLTREGRTIGVIALANRPGGYSREEQEALEALTPAIVEAFMRKRAEESLRHAANDLARSNRDLEQFAYTASHDLQEPLRTIGGFIDLLQDRYAPQLDDKAKEFIGYAVDGAERMSRMIRDLLAYSRVTSKDLKPKTMDANVVLRNVLAAVRGSIEDAGATVTHDELPSVVGDASQLALIFQNLIGNATKFRHANRPCQIHIGAKWQDGKWIFAVRDNGIGIPEDAFDRIFAIFQRFHDREKYPGTGIGLAICKRIVERHEGRIWAESKAGEGSTFYFSLPGAAPEGS